MYILVEHFIIVQINGCLLFITNFFAKMLLGSWDNITDLEFGRVQAQDMLQHLWTGPISNAAVDVVQGTKSVEVRPVGVSKV